MSSPARAQRRREGRTLLAALPDDPSMHLAAVLGLALEQAALGTLQPGCARCVRREKAAGAAEPQIRQAVTWQDGEPVCWDDFELGQ